MNPSYLDYFWQKEPQVFRFWNSLSKGEKAFLLTQLKKIDIATLDKQRQLVLGSQHVNEPSYESFQDFAFSGNDEKFLRGQKLIQEGRVGCLLLAGGQGTRLKHEGPKGTYPISIINHKSLFQLCAEKIKAASIWAQRPLRLAVMTSYENDQETRRFFQAHAYFGLELDQISFFAQESLPFLDAKGHLLLKTHWEIAEGPDGNGNSLLRFAEADLLQEWQQAGIEWINVILIDNPLADPFDAELVGYHQKEKAEITLKCTEKINPEEKVGVVVKQNGRCTVIEYSEMSEKEKQERGAEGRLKHCCANLSLFCMSLSFIQEKIDEKRTLPLHKAWKKGSSIDSSEHMAWKFETFIFDWLLYTQHVKALLYPRENCFAPLKNFEGNDSPETVRKAIQTRERALLQSITGLPAPHTPFELPAQFYYPTSDLRAKWKGHSDLK